MEQEKGKLVVIEGLDGSGKRTQTDLLVKFLQEKGVKVIQVSFPFYENDSSILVKKYLRGDYTDVNNQMTGPNGNLTFVKQMSSFYAVDRVSSFIEQSYDGKSLIEHLNEGTHIICDRYSTSNMLHQSGNLSNSDNLYEYLNWITMLEYIHLGLPKPDLVLYLDVLPEISVANIKDRYNGEAKEDIHEGINHLLNVFKIKDEVVDYCLWDPIVCYEGNSKMKPIDDIHQMILGRLRSKLPEIFIKK